MWRKVFSGLTVAGIVGYLVSGGAPEEVGPIVTLAISLGSGVAAFVHSFKKEA
jgi:hypothetical protein